MNRAESIVGRLLEDDPPEVNPQQPEQASPEGGEDVRDLFLRLTHAPEPFHAKGTPVGTRYYERIAERLGNRPKRKLANNTYLLRNEDGSIALRLHDTDIITYYPDGRTVVTTGGWPTMTTRERMSGMLPGDWAVYSESFKKHGEDAPTLYWEQPQGYFGYGGPREIRGGVGKMFWYNRATNAGTWESGWYIPFTDGDTIMPDGSLRHQDQPKQRGRKRAQHGWP